MTCLKSLQLWDTVGLLAENNHSKTYTTLFIKNLKSQSVVCYKLWLECCD